MSMSEYTAEVRSHSPLTSVCRVGSRCSSQVPGQRPPSIIPVSSITSQCQPRLSSLVSYAATVPVWGLGIVEKELTWAVRTSGKHWEPVCGVAPESTRTSSSPEAEPRGPQQANESGLRCRRSRFWSEKSPPYLTSDLTNTFFLGSLASPQVRSVICR